MDMTRLLVLASVLFSVGCDIEYGFQPDWGHRLRAMGCDLEDNMRADESDRPVAVCDASAYQVAAIFETVQLLDDSYDPNGVELIDRHWQILSAPEGSSAKVQFDAEGLPTFTADVVGTYEISLGVINADCLESRGCTVTIDAVPDEDLWVEMFWQHPNDDMDLHLLQDGAEPFGTGDCYYDNCIPGESGYLDWGTPMQAEDDPSLDLDDIPGTGPENINIYRPSGDVYHVMVHDHTSMTRQEANAVTVKIYLDGSLAYEETKTIVGEDTLTPFATIDYANGEILSL